MNFPPGFVQPISIFIWRGVANLHEWISDGSFMARVGAAEPYENSSRGLNKFVPASFGLLKQSKQDELEISAGGEEFGFGIEAVPPVAPVKRSVIGMMR